MVQIIAIHERAQHAVISEYCLRSHLPTMPLCKHCKDIDLISLWASKSPQTHQPSFLALTLSAEDCPSCDIIFGCLPSSPVAGHLLPMSLDQAAAIAPLKLVTVNGYKYATTVTDRPAKIDSLLFYFDDHNQIQEKTDVQDGHTHKADPRNFGIWLDAYANSGERQDNITEIVVPRSRFW